MHQSQRGFTLIEIAIVLIIIGLLLGGILKGQELITQGKVRSIEKEFAGISVAVLGYQDRYKALPGDDLTAAARWSGAEKGNGNGSIDTSFDNTTANSESRLFWNHLRRAGFINGAQDSETQPNHASGGLIGVQDGAGSTGGATPAKELAGLVICSNKLPAKIANALDAQLDDGLPNTGSVRSFDESNANPLAGASASSYADDDSKRYTLCKTV